MNTRNSIIKYKNTHLISALVPDQDYEGAMVFLDIIVDENGNAGVELLAHKARWLCVHGKSPEGK